MWLVVWPHTFRAEEHRPTRGRRSTSDPATRRSTNFPTLEINRHVEITTGNLHGGGYDADINSTESVMSKPKSRRIPHPLWFGIVAVLMVVLCVVLSVWIPYQKEQIAIREIERLGGSVEIHQGGSDLLREVGGADWIKYYRVSEVEINDIRFGDEELKHLSYSDKNFPIVLNNTSISDEA